MRTPGILLLLGLVLAGMLAASMSTYSGYLLAWSSVISQDVVIPLERLGDYSDGVERINIELSITNKLRIVEALRAFFAAGEMPPLFVAWGPPYTPKDAGTFVRSLSEKFAFARSEILCESRGGRPVPMLRIQEGERTAEQRFGVWVQARQHAWESGSSWVARGFGDWLTGKSPEAAWLRNNAEIVLVPIMDIDNAATGNGGKDALPQDHNRDWSDQPHWNEVKAAKAHVSDWISAKRMDVFLDLHNPAPGDPSFFYVLDDNLMTAKARQNRDRFVEQAYGRISKIKPLIPMSNRPKYTGPNYHPLWKQISSAWVAMNGNPETVSVCLETIWNYKNCNSAGYMAVGTALAEATQAFLSERARQP